VSTTLQNFYTQHPQLPLDNYWLWAELSDYRYFSLVEERFPIIYEKSKANTHPFVKTLHASHFLNTAYESTFGTALIQTQDLSVLLTCLKDQVLNRFQLCAPRLSDKDLLTEGQNVFSGEAGNDITVVGIIDDGFALFHEHFRSKSAQTNRVISYWDQSTTAQADQAYWSRQPLGASYGAEIVGRKLFEAAKKITTSCPPHQTNGEVFETACYREIGFPLARLDPRAHGTGVWHVCAGPNLFALQRQGFIFNQAAAFSEQYSAVLVQLPRATVRDTSGGSLARYALDGLRYIYVKARRYAGNAKLNIVTNVSFGSIGGPHDGSTILEQAIDEICRAPALTSVGLKQLDIDESSLPKKPTNQLVVLAAGNTVKRKIHASAKAKPKERLQFDVFVSPLNPRESFVEIWIKPDKKQAPLTIELASPSGETIQLTAGSNAAWTALNNQGALVWTSNPSLSTQASDKSLCLVALHPTQSEQGSFQAQSGVWSISVLGLLTGEVHAWIERNDGPIGLGIKQMAWFTEEETTNDDIVLSHIANGVKSIAVGACHFNSGAPSDYSPSGTRWGAAPKELIYAAADVSDVQRGLTIPGFFSGSFRSMSGTSLAAPFVTRHYLDELTQTKHSQILVNPFGLKQVVEKPPRDHA
jgi:hypothetical protein